MTTTIGLPEHQALPALLSQLATFRSSLARSSVAPSLWSNQYPRRKPAICRCTDAGVEIELCFEFYGSGASRAVVTTMRQSIESRWSAPGFRVVTKLGGGGAIHIDIVRGRGRSYMQGNTGTWYAENDPWSAAHEAGHLMELADRYTEVFRGVTVPLRGWEGTIMAQRMGIVTPADRQTVLDVLGCNCGGGRDR